MNVTAQLPVILICMALQAFFSGMETGVISIHRMRLRHSIKQGSRSASILEGFLDNTDRLLGTTLVGTNICVVIISVLAASMAVSLIGQWGETVSTITVSVMMLLFCEYLPKAWFHSRPLERCRRFAPILRTAELALRPVSFAFIGAARFLVRAESGSFLRSDPFITREDIKHLAREGEESGVLSRKERVMIHRVFELSHKPAGQVMVPRADMTVVHSDITIGEFLEIAREAKFTRYPVLDRVNGNFAGIINVFYVLSSRETRADRTVADFMRPPGFVPHSMPADDVLPHLRRSRQPMCLVRDAAGEVAGLITIEDILEEIVGKL
jgi:CBS domain containing-hemolysin-like protein